MFDKILVYENALADSHPALERATTLAKDTDTEVKVVDIAVTADAGPQDYHRKMRTVVELEREDRLEAICQPLHDLKINYSTELLRGRPFAAVIREVVHEGFDLVIKTASFPTPNDVTRVMGPVDMRLVRNCPCPVWLEVTNRTSASKTILVAIDPQAVIDDLNFALVKRSVKLARSLQATLHVVAAWEAMDETFLSQKIEPELLGEYLVMLESKAREGLDSVISRSKSSIQACNVHFRKGYPSEMILENVEKLQPDLVVMGTVCEAGIGDLLIGNTADIVLRQIGCSVLAIKPDGLFST